MRLSVFSFIAARLKAILTLLAICFFFFFIVAMKTQQTADDIWKQLGLATPDAHLNINNSFLQGRLYYFGAKNAKNVATDDRAAVVNQLIAYAQKYYGSPEFKTSYKNSREKFKPAEPQELPVPTEEQVKAEERNRLEQQLKVAEGNLNSPNSKIKNSAPHAIDNIKKQIQALDEPNNPTIKRRLDNANRMNDAIRNKYKADIQKFETRYPEDPQILLKKRLQEVLDITADVDYAAELKEGYQGKKVFVNPAYEKKPAEWKLAFRAGKPVTDAVRKAAQEWLSKLN
jgi:hypothetical protein